MSLVTFPGQGQVTSIEAPSLPTWPHLNSTQRTDSFSSPLLHSQDISSPCSLCTWARQCTATVSIFQRLDHFWAKHSRSFHKNLSFHLQLSPSWSHPRLPQSQDCHIAGARDGHGSSNHLRIFQTDKLTRFEKFLQLFPLQQVRFGLSACSSLFFPFRNVWLAGWSWEVENQSVTREPKTLWTKSSLTSISLHFLLSK